MAFILARIEELDLASIGNEEKGRVVNYMAKLGVLHPKKGRFLCAVAYRKDTPHKYRCPPYPLK